MSKRNHILDYKLNKVYVGDIIIQSTYAELREHYLMGVTQKGYYVSRCNKEAGWKKELDKHNDVLYKTGYRWDTKGFSNDNIALLKRNTDIPEVLIDKINIKQLKNRSMNE